jgi:hypothetical protein
LIFECRLTHPPQQIPPRRSKLLSKRRGWRGVRLPCTTGTGVALHVALVFGESRGLRQYCRPLLVQHTVQDQQIDRLGAATRLAQCHSVRNSTAGLAELASLQTGEPFRTPVDSYSMTHNVEPESAIDPAAIGDEKGGSLLMSRYPPLCPKLKEE